MRSWVIRRMGLDIPGERPTEYRASVPRSWGENEVWTAAHPDTYLRGPARRRRASAGLRLEYAPCAFNARHGPWIKIAKRQDIHLNLSRLVRISRGKPSDSMKYWIHYFVIFLSNYVRH